MSGTIPKNDTSQVTYTNKYSAFKLPETGGTGTILYTMAGGMALMFGAGFLYKKNSEKGGDEGEISSGI